ncbi:bifunctional nuclease family protein [Gemmatimonadota bacterium]
MQEFTVNGLAIDSTNQSPVVLLKELDGDRVLPVWIGPAEADAIAIRLAEVDTPRPLTHDLLKRVIDGAGLRLQRVIISEIRQQTFYAELVLEGEGRILKIDARPSDSIALALRTGAPIFISDELFQEEFGVDPAEDPERGDRLRQRLERIDPEEFGDLSL